MKPRLALQALPDRLYASPARRPPLPDSGVLAFLNRPVWIDLARDSRLYCCLVRGFVSGGGGRSREAVGESARVYGPLLPEVRPSLTLCGAIKLRDLILKACGKGFFS